MRANQTRLDLVGHWDGIGHWELGIGTLVGWQLFFGVVVL